jgi:hypothetical protein
MTRIAPSIKTLTTQLKDVDVTKAKQIRTAIKAEREGLLELLVTLDKHHRDIHWQRYNYINYNTSDLRAELLDSILGTFGVEYIFRDSVEGIRCDPESQHDLPLCTYLNAGDTYAPTLVSYRGQWRVGCWGDIAERYMK